MSDLKTIALRTKVVGVYVACVWSGALRNCVICVHHFLFGVIRRSPSGVGKVTSVPLADWAVFLVNVRAH